MKRAGIVLLGMLAACGSDVSNRETQPVAAPAASVSLEGLTGSVLAETSKPDAGPPEAAPLPTGCTASTTGAGKKVCVPDDDFGKRLCGGVYPEAALTLFAKGSPFTRAYATRELDAWNAGGGRTRRAKVQFDEEMLVIAYRKANPTGIVVVGPGGESGSFDVLRWNGSCVSLQGDEVTLGHPPSVKRAAVDWRHLEEPTRSALGAVPGVKASMDRAEQACAPQASAASPSEDACNKAAAAVTTAIATAVCSGLALPQPAKRP